MDEARGVVERFYERFGAGDMTAAFACFAPGCISLTPSGPLDNDRHEAAAWGLKGALPDAHMQLIRIVEQDGEVYVTGRFIGTHRADLPTPFGTIPASGNRLDLYFTDYFRVADGMIVECEAVWDRLGMIAQLGAASVGDDVGHLPAFLLGGGGGPPSPG